MKNGLPSSLVVMGTLFGGACGGQETVPVEVTFKASATGNGKEARYTNRSSDELICTILLTSAGGAVHTFPMHIAPGASITQSSSEGWTYSSGDTIFITCEGYREARITVP